MSASLNHVAVHALIAAEKILEHPIHLLASLSWLLREEPLVFR